MDNLTPTTAPDATGVLRYVGSLVGPWRWLIGIACLLAAGLTLMLFRSAGDVPAWTGKTIVKIGMVPGAEYLLQESGAPLVPIESNRSLVARISDPTFVTKVLGGAKFEPAMAAFSRKLAASSLRAVALEGDRNVAVEVSAGSSADVEAVFRSLADEINTAHEAIGQRRIDALRANLTDMQRRVDFIEKSIVELGPRMLNMSREGRDQSGPPVLVPNLAGAAEFWSKLRDRVQRNTNLLELTEKTVVYVEPGSYPRTERSIGPERAAILTGLAMLVAMVTLVIVTAPTRRFPK
ncbi:hypothetical protein JJB99_13850 [Bradyrhizobium diazoefficiens]|uniref:hypothetical protein n=1 Tax=Bradyrhizobium diazoefficiens TaxID=1355477 RepID=UPI00190C6250|nr:hypothetical protein [Bradyrhizobium diazoefficiens]QQO17135.1 hypothetical protein JJB99_13850 [Bradyrhizobium diazoefficiens]